MKITFLPLLFIVLPGFYGLPALADLPEVVPSNNHPAMAFEQVLAHTYETNPSLQSEREAVKILDERVSQANAGLRPTLALTGEIGQARVSQDDQAWRYGEDKNVGLVAIQPIYNATTYGQRASTKSRVMAGRWRLMATEQTVLLSVITAWLEMCEKTQMLTLTHENMVITQRITDATHQRFTSGDTTQTDVAVAESRLAESVSRAATAELALALSHIAYERITGLTAQSPDFPRLPLDIPRNNDEAVELSKNNPTIAQAASELDATENDINTAEDARMPYIYLRGSMTDEHATDLGLNRLRTDSITINASLPLYQGGLEYSRIREARLTHEKSRIEARITALTATEQARQAWNNFHTAQIVIDASNRAETAATQALSGIQDEYLHGTRTLNDVLDAQSQQLNAEVSDIQAKKNLSLEAFRLMAAVGRLTAKGLNLPTHMYDPEIHYNDVTTRWFDTSIDSDVKRP